MRILNNSIDDTESNIYLHVIKVFTRSLKFTNILLTQSSRRYTTPIPFPLHQYNNICHVVKDLYVFFPFTSIVYDAGHNDLFPVCHSSTLHKLDFKQKSSLRNYNFFFHEIYEIVLLEFK